MKYYLIAGEASGDLHGSMLIKALKDEDADAEFRCWGGDLMQQAGATLVKHYRELAFMGFIEVAMNLRTILKNIGKCKKDITTFKPDVIIYIDYPGFNFRIMGWAKSKGYLNFYYISPQIWAWKENRIKKIKRDVDRMFVILPFEKEFYEQKHGFAVDFVGHPLLDAIEQRQQMGDEEFRAEYGLDPRPIIALLPGSRKQEIKSMLEVMLDAVKKKNDYQAVIAAAPGQDLEFYRGLTGKHQVKIIQGNTYALLNHSHAALVTSGTATLEAALFQVPEVVCYRGSLISYEIAKRVIKLNYISLVNLIMDKPVVKELIQKELTSASLADELDRILEPSHRNRIFTDYIALREKLGGTGASARTAAAMYKELTARP
jgi:lipid-A-disaccharide synthase